MNDRLKSLFQTLLKKFTQDESTIGECWTEIENKYSERGRHYHTLTHLEDLLSQLEEHRDHIRNMDAVLFALYYHDVIYNTKRSDNEERSAALAAERMKAIGAPDELISSCRDHILATKNHSTASDADTNYFTDADLSVLGRPWEVYADYFQKIRKEYSVYPDFLYNPGRKKVLAHFLAMKNIFKTEEYISGFEKQARENLAKESALL